VALLRGINVGGHNKVAMRDLREILVSLGHGDVATYIQSGNAVFTSADPDADTVVLADAVERRLRGDLGVGCDVVVLRRDELAQVIADNPYPHETNPKYLHAVFRRHAMSEQEIAAVATAQQRAGEKGSEDEATVVGRTLFLWTPGGLGRSELAAQLSRSATASAGTARNWATVGKLMALLDE
jgi:uncharacterized protein (DUF1697 family)